MDAAGITEEICFHSGEILFSSDCYSEVMIADTVAATVACPPAFLGYCRNSTSGTVHVSGWC